MNLIESLFDNLFNFISFKYKNIMIKSESYFISNFNLINYKLFCAIYTHLKKKTDPSQK